MTQKNEKLKTGTFRMFSIDTPPEEARKQFKERYGYEPELCEEVNGTIWVGPILDK